MKFYYWKQASQIAMISGIDRVKIPNTGFTLMPQLMSTLTVFQSDGKTPSRKHFLYETEIRY